MKATAARRNENEPSRPPDHHVISEWAPLIEGIGYGGEVLEPRQVLEEGQPDSVGGAISILGDDELGDSRLVVGVVILRPMKEKYHVGILLDRARFA